MLDALDHPRDGGSSGTLPQAAHPGAAQYEAVITEKRPIKT